MVTIFDTPTPAMLLRHAGIETWPTERAGP
jgi:hypothetical protein